MKPFDLEVWYGERVAVLGSNGSGKPHFLRLLARGGSDPDKEHEPVEAVEIKPVDHTGKAKLGARVRPGWFVQTHEHPELRGRTLLEILHRGDEHRDGMGREAAARVLDRYELAHASEQKFESLSGGQQGGSRSSCSSSPARRCCCSTSPPTTSTCSRPRPSRPGWRPSTAPSSR